MKAFPTMKKDILSPAELVLATGADQTLYKFKITANTWDVALGKLTFALIPSTLPASLTKFSVYSFLDSTFTMPDTSFSPTGLINNGHCYNGMGNNTAPITTDSNGLPVTNLLAPGSVVAEIYPDTIGCGTATTTFVIPQGQTRWFRFAASIDSLAPIGTSQALVVQLEGDSQYPYSGGIQTMFSESKVDLYAHDDVIWSPISTTTTLKLTDSDFTNGFGVVGLPPNNMLAEVLAK